MLASQQPITSAYSEVKLSGTNLSVFQILLNIIFHLYRYLQRNSSLQDFRQIFFSNNDDDDDDKIIMLCVNTFMRTCHNMMLSQIFLAQQDTQREGWRNLYNSELYYINCLTALLGQSRERRRDGQRTWQHIENINFYNYLVSKLGVKSLLTGSRHT